MVVKNSHEKDKNIISVVVSVLTIPVHGAEGWNTRCQITPGKRHELSGKMVRNKWKRYEGYKYYFGGRWICMLKDAHKNGHLEKDK